MTNTLNADTITLRQIRTLRDEAIAHNDYTLADICDCALAPHETANSNGTPLIGPAGGRVSRTTCRQLCADAFNNDNNA